ncbi:hypothetical protein [Deinococcus sp.]|uniref:hypothetical protein n=1 Tax=Deinococcus sp. TaxID=47478 RepID=UPI0025B88AEE|nr:hypothetical protein [Deinococcus sp.]
MAPVLRELEDGFAAYPALLALLGGNVEPLKAALEARVAGWTLWERAARRWLPVHPLITAAPDQ